MQMGLTDQSGPGLQCLVCQFISNFGVQNFRTFTIVTHDPEFLWPLPVSLFPVLMQK